MKRFRAWLCAPVAVAAAAALTSCASDAQSAVKVGVTSGSSTHARRAHAEAAKALGMAPGCGAGFDVTPTGGSYDEEGTLTRASIGEDITITVTMRVQRATLIHRLQLIVGKPGSTPGVGSPAGSPPESMLREQNQAAVVDLYRGQAKAGRRLKATVSLKAPGRYPVEAVASSFSPGPCGGVERHHDVQSAQPMGYIEVH